MALEPYSMMYEMPRLYRYTEGRLPVVLHGTSGGTAVARTLFDNLIGPVGGGDFNPRPGGSISVGQGAVAVVPERLLQFGLLVHHEGAIVGNRLPVRLPGQQQGLGAAVAG